MANVSGEVMALFPAPRTSLWIFQLISHNIIRRLLFINLSVPKVYKVLLFLYSQMKLQKRFLRENKKKKYYKFMINLPPKIIKKLGWEGGDELEAEVEGQSIKLKKKSS